VVLEAQARLGARAFTERSTFGLPFDHGCAWLHSADKNPLTDIARTAGVDVVPDDADAWLTLDGEEADDATYEAVDASLAWIAARIEAAGDAGRDVAVTDAAPPRDAVDRFNLARMGDLAAGVRAGELSALDVYRQIGTGVEALVPAGLGSLIAAQGATLPVRLSTPVTRVTWDGPGVALETPAGTLTARAAIVTVSTGLLATDRPRFAPALPTPWRDAVRGLPMGLLDKVALKFDRPVFDAPANTTLNIVRNDVLALDVLLNPFGAPMAIGFVGGPTAWTLEADPDAAVQQALEVLVSVFGSDLRARLVRGHMTRWGRDRFAAGAYSAALPGHANARLALAEPLADRVFFAGEATDPVWVAQAAGAWRSGQRAAAQALAVLD